MGGAREFSDDVGLSALLMLNLPSSVYAVARSIAEEGEVDQYWILTPNLYFLQYCVGSISIHHIHNPAKEY